jgi:hypothetical protein
MKKLFLTSFVFTTGRKKYETSRLVVSENLDAAYQKAMDWFPTEFPESALISCVTHPAIE